MTTLATVLRQLLVASLLVGLTAGGLPPCTFAGGDCAATAHPRAAHACCCQGKCGGHCRMACCQQPAPSQDRPAPPTRLGDDHSSTWGLVASTTGAFDAFAAIGAHHDDSQLSAGLVPGGTLLALSIRFNV